MSKTYFGCGKKRNIGSFPVILAFIGLFLISNLGADCTDLGGGHINCNETVNSDIYNNMSNGVSSSSILSVNVENMHGMHNNNNGTWGFNEVNINVGGGTGGYGIYAQGANINIGNNADITTNGTGSYGVYAMSGSSITIGDNASISTHGYTFPSQSLSHGVYASSNSNITIGDNLNILTTGVGSAGIYTYGSTG
ncbi:MAG: hypothetical protein LBP54_04990, partial [Campylobacteraceae bacterium]|nr:hypothetical protein [Campylobacteraceae bacterium]